MAKVGRLEKRAMLSEGHRKHGTERARELLSHVDWEGKRDYLELGCGGGFVAHLVATEHGMTVTATDVDPEMVEAAARTCAGLEGVRTMVADATDLPFEDASFDMVLLTGILHHISGWRGAVSEVSRVLRPGGEFVIGEFAFPRFWKRVLSPFMGEYGVYTADELVECMEENGLEVRWRGRTRGVMFRYHTFVLSRT